MEIKRINCLDMFPDWMRHSRDLRVFTTVIDLLINDTIMKIYQLQECYDTDLTAEEQLSIIEDIVDLQEELRQNLLIDQKRILLKYYNQMYNYRGSINGIVWAIKIYNLLTENNNTNPVKYDIDIKITKTSDGKKIVKKVSTNKIQDINLLNSLIRTVIPPNYMLKLS